MKKIQIKLKKKPMVERHIMEFFTQDDYQSYYKNNKFLEMNTKDVAWKAYNVWSVNAQDYNSYKRTECVRLYLNDKNDTYLEFKFSFIDTGGWINTIQDIAFVQNNNIEFDTCDKTLKDKYKIIDEFIESKIIINKSNIEL